MSRPRNEHSYPWMISLAGVIWILVGTGIITSFGCWLLLELIVKHGPEVGSNLFSLLITGLFQIVVGGFFICEGVCFCRGTIPTTVGLGTGSFLFAVVFAAIPYFLSDFRKGFNASVPWSVAASLTVAGGLALAGKSAYENWWKTHHRLESKLPE
jgi:hypothetical protein